MAVGIGLEVLTDMVDLDLEGCTGHVGFEGMAVFTRIGVFEGMAAFTRTGAFAGIAAFIGPAAFEGIVVLMVIQDMAFTLGYLYMGIPITLIVIIAILTLTHTHIHRRW